MALSNQSGLEGLPAMSSRRRQLRNNGKGFILSDLLNGMGVVGLRDYLECQVGEDSFGTMVKVSCWKLLSDLKNGMG
jgi:hypothetical protein